MDRYIDDTILYDAQDYSDLVNVRRDNLLPMEGAGSTPETDGANRESIAGQENVPHFDYHYYDNTDESWGGNLYIFDSKGKYGCYAVYSIAAGSSDSFDELEAYGRAIADTFRVDEAYEPEEVKTYKFDDLGIKFSVKDGIEATKEDDDFIHVNYKYNGKSRWAYVVQGEELGDDQESMLVGACGVFSTTKMKLTSDMTPLDFGHYKGYWAEADATDDEGETTGAKIYVFSTNAGSDAKYQNYVVIGADADDARLKDIVGGFRFEGATAYDNTSVNRDDTVAITSANVSDEDEDEDVDDFLKNYSVSTSEYIFPGTDTREVTESDVNEFLDSYLDANNAKRLSDSEKRTLCARALCYARNEIYARHGYIFQSGELRDLFESMSWYRGEVPGDRFNSNIFNSAEKKNIEFLKSKMEAFGGYQPAK